MLTQYFVYYLIFFVIVEIEYISDCSGYNVSPTSYNNLKRFKRRIGCRRIEFACDNGQCHPLQDYCDGKIDCADESDEESDCNPDGCLDNEFQCEYGACIEASAKCDGKKDCRDNSDENEGLCNNTLRRNECLPPIVENGNYTVLDNIEYVSGELIPNSSLVNVYCVNHNSLINKPSNTIECVNGSFNQEVPKCILTCDTHFHYSIDVDCKLGEITQDCTKATKVRVGTIAHMKCKPNFIDKNPEIKKSECLFNGSWDVPFKQCNSPFIDKCPPILLSAVHVTCELNGLVQDCRKEVPHGTYSRMTCKPNYMDVTDNRPLEASCRNGTWTSPPLKKCIPACSGIVREGEPFIVNGTSANIGDFPWHVGIYRQKPQEHIKYLCGGSIISVKVVLSAAHCFTNQNNGKLYLSSEFSVAAGKTYNNWDADEDEHYVQKRNVESIHIPDDIYFGQLMNFAGDLAVVVVEKIFTFNNFVHAVCVDWNLEYTQEQLLDGTLGKVAGWGATSTGNVFASAELRQLRVPYVKREKCVKIVPYNFISFITIDKFCAGYTNGSSICNGDSGGGLIFSHRNKYYIQGIVSIGPTKDSTCNDFQLGAYTKIGNYILFIKKIEESNRMTTSEDCVVPKIRNGKVSVSGQDYTPGSLVKDSFEITIECNSGYKLSANHLPKCIGGQWSIVMPRCENETETVTFAPVCPPIIIENGRYDIEDNPNFIPRNPIPEWVRVIVFCNSESYALTTNYNILFCINGIFSHELPKCVLSCAARSSTISVDIKCEFDREYRNCSERLPEGTIATMKCKQYYFEPVQGPSTAVCTNGSWTEDLIKCIPECGELVPIPNVLVANNTRDKNDFPWRVHMYTHLLTKLVRNVCGGSIISATIVLTAANCFKDFTNEGKLYPTNHFELLAGESVTQDIYSTYIQRRNIFQILIPPNNDLEYQSSYAGNIAVVVVDYPWIFTEYIKPVCVDWNSEFIGTHLRSGAIGEVNIQDTNPSFGFDLKQLTLTVPIPYIDRGQCLQIAPQDQVSRKFITIDSYCAGEINGSSICKGVSGSGLVFAQDEFRGKKYYIQGVVSYSLSASLEYCDANKYRLRIVARVASYIDFIKSIEAFYRIN